MAPAVALLVPLPSPKEPSFEALPAPSCSCAPPREEDDWGARLNVQAHNEAVTINKICLLKTRQA